MTEQEKFILSIIARDEATGNHLLRTPEEWKALNIDIDQYIMLKDELEMAIKNFKWEFEDESSHREKDLLVHYKCYQDYDFDDVVNSIFKENL